MLGLLEACGGRLSGTDMEKLLFGYCQFRHVNYYDFFPHRFGCFSFLSYQDKHVLTMQGHLKETEAFELKRRIPPSKRLDQAETEQMKLFCRQVKGLRGDALVREIYLAFPYFAHRSEIKTRVLSPMEIRRIESAHNPLTEPSLMTIGYEGLTIDAYLNKLIAYNVAMVIDVRRNPISMKYGFSKTRFGGYLARVGIGYRHIPELGIESSLRRDLETKEDYRKLFDYYASRTLPRHESELQTIREILATRTRVALTCFEASAESCHRHKITECLTSSADWTISVEHI